MVIWISLLRSRLVIAYGCAAVVNAHVSMHMTGRCDNVSVEKLKIRRRDSSIAESK